MGKGCSTYYSYLKFTLVCEGFAVGLYMPRCEEKKKILLTNEIVRNWWFELF
jgi:hypothetical protein